MKFKVGDKVRVKELRDVCGLVFTVTECDEILRCYRISRFDRFGHEIKTVFIEDMLEPVCDAKIVITTNGKETLARLYEDGEVKKSAKAECSPDDTFDFSFGAKLAFERLTKPTPKFRAGDKVIGNAKAERYCITMKDRRGTVEKVNPDGSIDVRDNRWPAIKFKKLDPDCFDFYTEPEYYNGKVVCVEKKRDYYAYTVGKIYEFKDGRVKIDNGFEIPDDTRVKSLDEWNDRCKEFAKFIEIKE